MSQIVPPVLPESVANMPDISQEPRDTSLVAQEPAVTSGSVASIASIVSLFALVLKVSFGFELSNEIVDAVVNLVALSIPVVAPLFAAFFTRQRVSPVK